MPKLSLAKLERHLYAAADILRREGLDAATYKDYIFGLLFLKRASDVFDAERERIVGRKVEGGMEREAALVSYGENPDFYDSFFVPKPARWTYLQGRLNDSTAPFGRLLDIALSQLAEHNDRLEHVLDHIAFMRTQGTKRIVSDEACRELVRHFSRYRLRNEDFQFSDLLGAAYEFLINMFAESAGKKGGDFYTPRDVIRLMVRILKPQSGLSVYDPTCGSGGMLIISREYVEQSGGDPTNLRLCGQVNDASAWSICKLNMLLHGVPDADIQLQDTLLHPMHREAGELERFHRVIANPPFSQNYTRTDMEYPERFQWGWTPTSGKKADLMFAQHMLAVCRDDGLVATVMPHGVLFRGGAEKEIRRQLLEDDLVEAIIALPPNLFYGAGIPACILVMRPNRHGVSPNPNKPMERQGQVLFINADAEFHSGRAQNYLLPEHVEKIASNFERFEDVPGYARRVSIEEIASEANDFSLNIRRYVDNSPPPEPHDVHAHLLGGVPAREVETRRALCDSLGFDPLNAFVARPADAAYLDFAPVLSERAAIRPLVEGDDGVQNRMQALRGELTAWWTEHALRVADLPARRDLNAVRAEFLESFVAALLPAGTLSHFTLSGVVASWWTDTLPDLKTLLENGFPGVIDGWVDAIADAVEDEDGNGPVFNPYRHKLVRRLMGDYLERITAARAEIARLKAEKEAFEQSNQPEDADEDELESWNFAKELERQRRELRAEHRSAIRELNTLDRRAGRVRATEADRALAAASKAALLPVLDRLTMLEAQLVPYEQIKDDLTSARAQFRELISAFVRVLQARCMALDAHEKRELVLELFAQDLQAGLDVALSAKRHELVRFIEGLWDKYKVTLTDLTTSRENVERRLNGFLTRMRYV
jgi:type I restriction enzyme M protein